MANFCHYATKVTFHIVSRILMLSTYPEVKYLKCLEETDFSNMSFWKTFDSFLTICKESSKSVTWFITKMELMESFFSYDVEGDVCETFRDSIKA